MKTKDESLAEIGTNAMATIREMVAALECDYDRLEELREAIKSDEFRTSEEDAEEREELAELEKDAGDCNDRDDAAQRIWEDPLSLEFRSGWSMYRNDLQAQEFCLLLTTGGPAVRIIGEIRDGEAHSANLEVQDWGTPWTQHITTGADHKALMTYVRCFCFA